MVLFFQFSLLRPYRIILFAKNEDIEDKNKPLIILALEICRLEAKSYGTLQLTPKDELSALRTQDLYGI